MAEKSKYDRWLRELAEKLIAAEFHLRQTRGSIVEDVENLFESILRRELLPLLEAAQRLRGSGFTAFRERFRKELDKIADPRRPTKTFLPIQQQ